MRFISLPSRERGGSAPFGRQVALLRATGRRIWLFFTHVRLRPKTTRCRRQLPGTSGAGCRPSQFAHQLRAVSAVVHRCRDFGWIGLADLAGRIEATSDTLLQLPRHPRHFFNWYETRELARSSQSTYPPSTAAIWRAICSVWPGAVTRASGSRCFSRTALKDSVMRCIRPRGAARGPRRPPHLMSIRNQVDAVLRGAGQLLRHRAGALLGLDRALECAGPARRAAL